MLRKRLVRLMLFAGLIFAHLMVSAGDLVLPPLFSNNMVLQRDVKIPVWGWASKNEKVNAIFKGKTYQTTAGADGKWILELNASKAGGPFNLIIKSGADEIKIENILMGDVFLCSGQSNMEFGMHNVRSLYQKDIDAANNKFIRHFKIEHATALTPVDTFRSVKGWQETNPSNVMGFSAVAYFFARDLYEHSKVPIGLLNSSWGASFAEAWTSRDGLKAFPQYLNKPEKEIKQSTPMVLYNAMIEPIKKFPVKSILWYQGEFNKSRAYQYRALFPTMISDWRKQMGRGNIPFVFVQLPNYDPIKTEPGQSEVAELREAQEMTIKLPNTAMVVTIETNSSAALHPLEKKPIGDRLSLAVRNLVFKENINASGPFYQSSSVAGNKIIIKLKNAKEGVHALGGEAKYFTLAGADKKFYNANAVIKGNTIEVSCPEVPQPVAVRYCWSDNPIGANVYGKNNLPLAPFRSDDWQGITENHKTYNY